MGVGVWGTLGEVYSLWSSRWGRNWAVTPLHVTLSTAWQRQRINLWFLKSKWHVLPIDLEYWDCITQVADNDPNQEDYQNWIIHNQSVLCFQYIWWMFPNLHILPGAGVRQLSFIALQHLPRPDWNTTRVFQGHRLGLKETNHLKRMSLFKTTTNMWRVNARLMAW